MIKIIILITLCLLIIFVSYKICDYYKQRQIFFENITNFCVFLQNEISFLKTDLTSCISKYKKQCKGEFLKVIDCYLENLKTSKNLYEDNINALNKCNLLNEMEREKLSSFFSSLGKSSQQDELVLIENFKNDFSNKLTLVKQDNSKYGNLSIKLGLLLSLAVFIIFI